ncbi:hypothetical protein NUU61_000350 [Penicillium alfredii]|uniref:Uncharacterized protein n=1 Tax=Penicillium alfredii TaxID=1506179 RepID=A0A9W9G9M6_9EURO|nr:uncharacterized protein NUU61_000350 [Penicillium alfredii]KAJ5114591.1 hypothetical protein NUU61_000350 [Penicillium alfredii]
MEADPDTQVEVDFMIRDYLACIAIDGVLTDHPGHDVDWLVHSIQTFQSSRTESPAPPPSRDLKIKLQLLTVAHRLRGYTPARDARSRPTPTLSAIAIEFMDLCSAAVDKVSEPRWFDIGARFMLQAVLEEHRIADRTPSQALRQLFAWAPGEPDRDLKWAHSRHQYSSDLPLPGRPSAPERQDALAQKFPLFEFKNLVIEFLRDLMTTLDPPILIQLERGKLGSLSRAETQQLKARIGLR